MRSPRFVISMWVALCALVAGPRALEAASTFNVVNNGFTAYTIDGVDNPTLTLTRGQTYTFNVTAVGHPFWLATARGAGGTSANAFSAGVSGNGASPGTVTFAVPASAPATLFYQCSFHDPMGGTLVIVSPPAVVAAGPAMVGALALLLLVLVMRRRSFTRP